MKTDMVKAIFTNVLFVIGVILLIFGFIRGTSTAVKLLTFDQYPLQSYEETRCESPYMSEALPGGEKSAPTESELTAQRERCLASLARDRQLKQTEDIVTSITTLVSGAVLVYGFRRFIFK